ncbi:hypothetical protein, partial [Ralstonia solanacearum]|uniref:hypothetical protein n=1 Tax=Ralstonia solanacearum TaxID=305 RepID=UPI00399D74BC
MPSWFFGLRKGCFDSARFFAAFAPILARFARSGRNAPRTGQQLPPGEHQIGQTKQAEQLRRVLGHVGIVIQFATMLWPGWAKS